MRLEKNKNNRWCLVVEKGARFGHLTVIKEADPVHRNGRNCRRFECLCECGNTHTSALNDLRSGKAARCNKCKIGFVHPSKIYFNDEQRKSGVLKHRKTYYAKHRDVIAIKRKIYNLNNKEKVRHREKIRHAREKGAPGKHSYEQWVQLKYEYRFMCPYCLRYEPEIALTKDHIIPISKGGSNYIDNIQPLCQPCNASKSNKIQEHYHTSLFRFSDDFNSDGFDKEKYIKDHLAMMELKYNPEKYVRRLKDAR